MIVSAPAAAVAVRGGGDRASRNFYPSVARLHLGAVGLAVVTLLLIDGLVGGAFGDPLSVTANPLPLLIWVDFWVGLGVVSALVPNTAIAASWLAHGELFTVRARTLGRFAPLEPYVREPAGPCPAGRCVWSGLPGVAVWWIQVGLIIRGHVVAVLEAHRIALTYHRSGRRALAVQLPLVLLMVGYTFSGLWVLGQALQPFEH